ncbi:MAG: RagB/SusD family nutrient uptake outer membrane protein [Bacteroidota bacterium]|uniref:RagB/SusD family nutrient uptake outer membrane protein n=1 Tax=Pedobacter cryotolerans TaxID=2571270 RepID=A0A4U1CAR2_9SPHI|nr:RagB/SusD family nutrient uptake outer membrane protein [Pedobacter cryotolerans]TKC02020.1 RagB/SusD family nutrient uptake outer membrane protein [Pedobacter cryotolerans]
MKNFKIKSIYIACGILTLASSISSCKSEFEDPSRASLETALGSSQALSAVAVGVQRTYTLNRTSVLFNSIAAAGFAGNELKLLNSGNIPELQLSTGGTAVDGTNTILFNMWASSLKVIDESNKVIAGANALGDKNYASGLIGYVTIFKALSLGTISTFWEQVPVTIGTNVPFVSRADGYKAAITAIDDALAKIAANPISTQFNVTVPNVNIINTLRALKARYALFSGQYALALTEANAVTLTTGSSFTFDSANINILNSIIASNNVFQPIDANLGLAGAFAPDALDRRLSFYTFMAGTPTPTIRMGGFAATTTTAIPIFLPGEITLIKAEAYARQTTPDLTNALIELNRVVTKTTDVFGVAAALPALVGPFTQAEILNLIYKHRSIELYASGLKLEDMRRFGRPNAEMKRRFMPYPFQERDNNPNTPANPAF